MNILELIKIFLTLAKYRVFPKKHIFLKALMHVASVFIFPMSAIRYMTCSQGEKIKMALLSMGPVYIKFGQMLSSCPDVIGVDISNCLKELQDRLPPFYGVDEIIERNFGMKTSEVFMKFDYNPIAAASIAQVHSAMTLDCKPVAVKILRPGIGKIYRKNISSLKFISGIISRFCSRSRRFKLIEIISILERNMNCELNLLIEASNASEMRENFLLDQTVYVPIVYWDLTTEQILVMEKIDGASVYNLEKLKASGVNINDIANNLIISFLNQAYRDGFFHADLHPGNILIKRDGSISFLDFGITERLMDKDRIAIAEILYKLINEDYLKVAQIHLDAGYIPCNTDLHSFSQSLRAIGSKFINKSTQSVNIGGLLSTLLKVREEYSMQVQPQLVMLQKTTLMVEGICKNINPEINVWEVSKPWVKIWASKNITKRAKILRVIKNKFNKFIDELEAS